MYNRPSPAKAPAISGGDSVRFPIDGNVALAPRPDDVGAAPPEQAGWLSSPWRRGLLVGLLISFVVALPTLWFGFFLDDYPQMLTMENAENSTALLNLYSFNDGTREQLQEKISSGAQPWFTHPERKLRLFRPLSSLAMAVDYKLFGRNPIGSHVHSILWYLALVAAVALVLRQSVPGSLGLFTLLLFVVDDAHWLPVAWWSNRNAVIALVPALLGLAAHLRWRTAGWKPGLPLSLAGYALGLLGGEVAVGVFGYLLAYELLGARASLRNRVAALAPGTILLFTYLAGYSYFGFGTHGSGMYIDPMSSPLEFLAHVPRRLLLLAGAHFFFVPPELDMLFAWAPPVLTVACLAAVGVMTLALLAVWPHLEGKEKRAVRWLLAGSVLSCFPLLATFPASRLLLLPSMGGAAGIAVVIRHMLRARKRDAAAMRRLRLYEPAAVQDPARPSRRLRWLAWVLVVLHLVASPLAWPFQTYLIRQINGPEERAVWSLPIDGTANPPQKVVLLHTSDVTVAFLGKAVRAFIDAPQPDAWWTLSIAPHDHRLTRTAADTFEMETLDGDFLSSNMEHHARNKNSPLHLGETVELDGLTITVREMGEEGPKRLAFRFGAPLDDHRYVFVVGHNKRLHPFTMPAIGESALIPAV